MLKSFRQKIISSAVVILLCFLIFAGAAYWLSSDISQKTQKISQERALLFRFSQLAEVLANLKNNATVAASYEEKINNLLPGQEDLLNFPRWLDGVARAQNLSLRFNFQGDQVMPQGNNAGYLRFTLQITGPSQGILNFLSEVEEKTNQYLMTIDQFELSRAGSDQELDCQGLVYFK